MSPVQSDLSGDSGANRPKPSQAGLIVSAVIGVLALLL